MAKRTELDTLENLIAETGLNDNEAGTVVGDLLGQKNPVEITASLKKLNFPRKRFTDLIKSRSGGFLLVNSDYVTVEAIRAVGSTASEDHTTFRNCRSAVGSYVRSGEIKQKMYVDVGCAGEKVCLFRLADIPKIVEICLGHVTFQKLAPGYISPKAIVATQDADRHTRDEKQFDDDQVTKGYIDQETLTDLNSQLHRAKSELSSLRLKYDAAQVDLRAEKESSYKKDDSIGDLTNTVLAQELKLKEAAAGYTFVQINRREFELHSESAVFMTNELIEFVLGAEADDYGRENERKLIDDMKRGIQLAAARNKPPYMMIGRVPSLLRLYDMSSENMFALAAEEQG